MAESRQPAAAVERNIERDRRAERWEQRLALPVILAAAVSVPAVFLTMLDHHGLALTGHLLNWTSLLVLAAEAVLLLVLCGNKRAWLWRHRWSLLITLVAVPAVIFAFAPMQALRLLNLVRVIGTLRILRANTIVSAGRILARRFGLTGVWRYTLVIGGSLLAAGFVAMVLTDPTATREHRRLLEEIQPWLGPVPMLVAGAILAIATGIVVYYRRRTADPAPAAEQIGDRHQ